MTLNSFALIVLTVIVYRCAGQDKSVERIDVIHHFVKDLRNGKSKHEIFTKYLSSRGLFRNDTVRSVANQFTDLLRTSVQSVKPKDEVIYKYIDRPEKATRKKSVNDPSSDVDELPLQFHLDTNSTVGMEDLYVIKLADERIFVLFDEDNRIETYFGIQWGHKVSFVKF